MTPFLNSPFANLLQFLAQPFYICFKNWMPRSGSPSPLNWLKVHITGEGIDLAKHILVTKRFLWKAWLLFTAYTGVKCSRTWKPASGHLLLTVHWVTSTSSQLVTSPLNVTILYDKLLRCFNKYVKNHQYHEKVDHQDLYLQLVHVKMVHVKKATKWAPSFIPSIR